ncbi:MAG: DHH family phosphoesterase [Leptospiraceae bacterium]|nr:DHH family phosphoesterase [Leptospiraceae bacterium]
MKSDAYKTVLDLLLSQDDFVITTHRGPDADGVGACLALAWLLQSNGKQVHMITNEPIPARLKFLDAGHQIHHCQHNSLPDLDLPRKVNILCVDNSDPERLGVLQQLLQSDLSNLIVIDHHDVQREDYQHHFTWPAASSTCEIAYEILAASGLLDTQALPIGVANAIYAGIVIDSGHFRFSKTSPRTHEIAAHLLQLGVRSADVAESLLARWPVGRLQGRRKLYEQLHVSQDERIAWFIIDKRDLDELNISFDDLDGIINELIEPEQVQIGIIFSRREANQTRVSARSKQVVNLLPAVEAYGGGGHKNACGATIPKDLSTSVREFLQRVESCLPA